VLNSGGLPLVDAVFTTWRPPLVAGDLTGGMYEGADNQPCVVVGRIVGTNTWWVACDPDFDGCTPGLAGPMDDDWLRYFLQVGPRPAEQCHRAFGRAARAD
jgi:hypothetical protein